jgi:hypothetical protein
MNLAKIIAKHEDIERRIEKMKVHVAELQANCPHDGKILLVPFESSVICDKHELRLCPLCGIQESGWSPKALHSGYGIDNRDVKVTSTELYEVRSQIRGRTRVGNLN